MSKNGMDKEELKSRLQDREFVDDEVSDESVSVVSANLPKITSSRRMRESRRAGFWPEIIEKVKRLPVNQAVKIKLLQAENPNNFRGTAKAVAKQHGFYINAIYKYPFMYMWPDRMRGKVLPQDFNSQGAVIFDNEEEIQP